MFQQGSLVLFDLEAKSIRFWSLDKNCDREDRGSTSFPMLVDSGGVSLPKAEKHFYAPHEVEKCCISSLVEKQ